MVEITLRCEDCGEEYSYEDEDYDDGAELCDDLDEDQLTCEECEGDLELVEDEDDEEDDDEDDDDVLRSEIERLKEKNKQLLAEQVRKVLPPEPQDIPEIRLDINAKSRFDI